MTRARDTAERVVGTAVDRLAAVAASIVSTDSALRPLLRDVRRRLPRPKPAEPLARLVFEFARLYPDAFFIQVGANDGSKNDYLNTHVETRRWKGILIEPIPYVFSNLARRHGGNPALTLINAAIAEQDGTAELYYLPRDEDPNLPPWYDQLASFREEVILKHEQWIPDIKSRITTIEVPTVTFDSLCTGQGVRQFDLVQVDTEGYDFEIVKQIDLDRYKPAILLYEHCHLGHKDRRACEKLVRSHGYRSISNFMDTACVRDDPQDGRARRLIKLVSDLERR